MFQGQQCVSVMRDQDVSGEAVCLSGLSSVMRDQDVPGEQCVSVRS